MSELFYTIANVITAWISGIDIETAGAINVIRYIKVLENVKYTLNVAVLVLIGACVICITCEVIDFVYEKKQNKIVSTKDEA